MNIGRAIKLCRTQRGWTQSQLAIVADVSFSYLSMIERNKRDVTFSTLVRIAKAVNMPLVLLLAFAMESREREQLEEDLRGKLINAAFEQLKS